MAENVASWAQSILSRAAGAASRHRHALRLLLIAAPLLVVCGSTAVPAMAGSTKVDTLVRDLSARAARGEADPRSAYDALIKAGMSEADAGAMTDALRDAA